MSTTTKLKLRNPVVAVIGNPNTGKSTLFNLLTGLKQHVGNYAGVTVERKMGTARLDDWTDIELIDLPGTYSLAARSPDEMIAVDVLLNQQPGAPTIDAILAIADASNPERNFYLISQLLETGLPVVVALNMLDVAVSKGITLNPAEISQRLGTPVVGICANKGQGIPALKAALAKALTDKKPPSGILTKFPDTLNTEVAELLADLNASRGILGRGINRVEAFRALIDKGGHAEQRLRVKLGPEFLRELEARRKRASTISLQAEEVRTRYAWAKKLLAGAVVRPDQPPTTHSDTADKYITHWFTGTLIFVGLMFIVFQTIFSWATPLMEYIKSGFDWLAKTVPAAIPEGALHDLVADGVIKGVGAVLVFLPQICLLFLFIALMEDCGYMARAAFLMDRLLSRVGLSGKSFIPMLSSFACAVPGIMATRTIENWRDRVTTIIVAPLMSCSARLPVYGLMIYSFIPERSFGPIGLRGVVLFGMYFVGLITAVPVAWILKKTLLKGETPPFLIELPSYKIPDWRGVLLRVYDRAKAFVIRAGTIILAVSVVVWALAYFPHNDPEALKLTTQVKALDDKADSDVTELAAPLTLVKWTKEGKEGKVPQGAMPNALDEALVKADELEQKRDQRLSKLDPLDENADEAARKNFKEDEAKINAEFEKEMAALKATPGNSDVWMKLETIRQHRAKWRDAHDDLIKKEAGAYLRNSYFGRTGRLFEPVFKPLGWDWRISMAAMASFPAREVIVATLGTIFNQGDVSAESTSLREELRKAEWLDQPGRKLFNIPVALSVMVFFALCSQCAATLATIKRETNGWFWPAFSFTYMTVFAYIGAMIVYQVGMMF